MPVPRTVVRPRRANPKHPKPHFTCQDAEGSPVSRGSQQGVCRPLKPIRLLSRIVATTASEPVTSRSRINEPAATALSGWQWAERAGRRGRRQEVAASFSFSPACLRLPLTASALPWVSSLLSPEDRPAADFSFPLATWALSFALSTALMALHPLASLEVGCPRRYPEMATVNPGFNRGVASAPPTLHYVACVPGRRPRARRWAAERGGPIICVPVIPAFEKFIRNAAFNVLAVVTAFAV